MSELSINLGNKRQLAEEGNTVTSSAKKQGTRHSFYCFTAFGFDNIDLLKERMIEIGKKGIIGNETCPTTGNKHLQCFIALKKPMRITELKLPFKPHIEACKGSEEQNAKYCKKDNNYWTFGFPKPLKTLLSLKPWQMEIEKIYMTEPDDRKIYWFYEEIGGVGKSSFIKYMIIKYNILFCSGGKHNDIMNLVFNQDMDTTTCVIFDIPRANKGHISYASLECIKNGMVCNTKYETGVKVFNSPHVFIFANFPPDQPDLLSIDRWLIYKIGEEPFV